MIKRILTLCLLMAGIICNAQTSSTEAIGEWQVYPSYWQATKSIAVGRSLYVLTNGNLLRYDTDDTSVVTYNSLDHLNDVGIAHIDYSPAAKRLLIVYSNCNIDLMDADGEVINLSSLKDKAISGKKVNSVYIHGHMAYLCTEFGIVEVDMREGIFRNTYQLGPTSCMTVRNDQYFIAISDTIYRAPITANLYDKSVLTVYTKLKNVRKLLSYDGSLWTLRTNDVINTTKGDVRSGQYRYMNALTDGSLVYGNGDKVCFIKPGGTTTTITVSNDWQDILLVGNTYWMSSAKQGLVSYRLQEDTFVATGQCIQPNSPMNDFFYRMSYVGDHLLVAGGINTYQPIYNEATSMVYSGGNWTNFDHDKGLQQLTDQYGSKYRLVNTTNLIEDPADPTHHYASIYRSGLAEYRNGKMVKLYGCDNSPLRSILPDNAWYYNYVGCSAARYDREGNIWVANQETDTIIRILKPNGRWERLYYEEIKATPTCEEYCFTQSGVNFLVSRRMDGRGIFGFHTNGTLSNMRDDKHTLRTTITNEDGTSYTPDEFYCATEDLNGQVWVGTNLGLFVIEDPSAYFNANFTFLQIKVARNDGSGLADYLLSGVPTTCIAVDGANRKWIGTKANGLYLVSADGQQMIHHFQAEDSPLLSDNIQALAIDPATGRVMIGTDVGLCSYMSDAIEPEEDLDFSNIKVYPNPVGPDYRGPITIDGLTMDAEVKICSATGQLITGGISNGGRITWDGCDSQGRRVASGVYQVIVNTSQGKSAVVARIIMIK